MMPQGVRTMSTVGNFILTTFMICHAFTKIDPWLTSAFAHLGQVHPRSHGRPEAGLEPNTFENIGLSRPRSDRRVLATTLNQYGDKETADFRLIGPSNSHHNPYSSKLFGESFASREAYPFPNR